MRYTLSDIQKHFDAASFARGQGYHEDGRVIELETADRGQILSGRVRGSGTSIYRTQIQLREDARLFASRCNCPVGRQCKHAVALLLTALDQQPQDGLSHAVSAWVDDLFAVHQHSTAPPDKERGHLSYDCRLPEHPEPHVAVSVHRGRSGAPRLASSKPMSLGTRAQRSNIPDTLDRQCVSRLRAYADENPYIARLADAGSGELFETLVSTGRCHWDHQTQVLKLGPPVAAQARWQLHSDGSQSLHLEIAPHIRVLPLEPPYYVDIRKAQVGLVSTELSPAILPLLSRSPRIAPNQIREFTQLLDQRGITGVPRPLAPQTRVLDAKQVHARLELMHIDDLAEARDGFVPDIYVARLQACYEDFCFIPTVGEATSVRKHADQLVRIERNLRAEQALLDQMIEFHSISVPGGSEELTLLTPYDGTVAWAHFLDSRLPQLREQGWRVEIRDSFDLRLLEAQNWALETTEKSADWFELSAGFEVDGQRYNLLDLLVQLLHESPDPQKLLLPGAEPFIIELGEGRLLRLPRTRVQQVLSTLLELYRDKPLNRGGKLKLHSLDLARLEGLGEHWTWAPPARIAEYARSLRSGTPKARMPAQFQGTLRDYQAQGLAWMQHLAQHDLGGVLADDMGLGKTVQTLAHLAYSWEQRPQARFLIVAPTSVIGNWRNEAQKFTPNLNSLVWHGKDRRPEQLVGIVLVITSYATLLRDQDLFTARDWQAVVLDEAQFIKNPRAKIALCVRRLKAEQRLCLSGTPMENHLGELWSLLDFTTPGYLGDARSFKQLYRTPIEKQADKKRALQLSQRIAPLLLRRRKDEVAKELPPKSEILRSITLGDEQAALYETIRVSMERRIRDAVRSQGVEKSQIVILDALLKLRQICCDPRLVKLEQASTVQDSAKLDALMDMLPELIEDGRRILLFSQFTQMLSLIEERLELAAIPYLKLTGASRNRQDLVDRFQTGEVPLFLISLKAGGTGLNLTAADTVIHYDPWWNPAVENQATDRAHRIGQDKPVFVYKLICENSVEQRIQQMQARKQQLSDQLYLAQGGALEPTDVDWLLQPLDSS